MDSHHVRALLDFRRIGEAAPHGGDPRAGTVLFLPPPHLRRAPLPGAPVTDPVLPRPTRRVPVPDDLTPIQAAVHLHQLISSYEREVARLVPLRRKAFRAALVDGLTAAGLGRLCGISRARVSVLARWGDDNRSREQSTEPAASPKVDSDVPAGVAATGVERLSPAVGSHFPAPQE